MTAASILVAVPKPERAPKARRPMRRANPRRRRRALAEDFGDLADVVRTLPCCVAGCTRGPSDPAHVHSRGAGGHAWIKVGEQLVGNLAPLCREHHREQHQRGARTFYARHSFVVALGADEFAASTLEEIAESVGRWFKGGAA